MANDNRHELFNFPCQFPIKCMGEKGKVETATKNIIQKHIYHLQPHQIKIRPSAQGKYCAITITILANSRVQLNTIYSELNAHPYILYTL